MIYECFPFFNELDLLWLRLNVLRDTVERFVLVEGRETFSFQPKPLYYEENKERFKPFADKIIHVVYDKIPDDVKAKGDVKLGLYKGGNQGHQTGKAYFVEEWVKSHITKALIEDGAKEDDWIIISDADEIPPSSLRVPEPLLKKKLYHYRQRMYCYYLNGFTLPGWSGSVIGRFDTLMNECGGDPLAMRRIGQKNKFEIKGGWHFTCLGTAEDVVYKLQSYSHYYEHSTIKNLAKDVEEKRKKRVTPFYTGNKGVSYEPLEGNIHLPDYLLKHKQEFKHLLMEKK